MKYIYHKTTYKAWAHMKERCDNPLHEQSHRYSRRGITYDPRWKDYTAFVEDLGYKPEGLTLERKDNNKGYYKENCKWATWEEQSQNKSKYISNTSGIVGVSYSTTQKKWVSKATSKGRSFQLYKGKDFFEACCARKSYDAERTRNKELQL